jgi:hypothetical protein
MGKDRGRDPGTEQGERGGPEKSTSHHAESTRPGPERMIVAGRPRREPRAPARPLHSAA